MRALRLNPTLMLVLLAAARPAALAAQDAASRPAVAVVPYSDYTIGFEMSVPAGWRYDRTAFFGPDESLGLLRGQSPDGRQSLQVLLCAVEPSLSLEGWLERFLIQVGRVSDTRTASAMPRPHGTREAAVIDVDSRIGAESTKALYLCVRFDSDKIWLFSLAAVVANESDQAIVRSAFEQLAAGVRIVYDAQRAAEINAAFERGEALAGRLERRIGELKLDAAPRYYEISLSGKPIGYLSRRFSREEHSLDEPADRGGARRGTAGDGKDGLCVREESWRFADDRSARFNRVELFCSLDLQTELTEHWSTQLPPPDAVTEAGLTTRDQCVRQDNILFSSFSTSADRGLPAPRAPIKLSPRYLPLTWARVLPALLGPEEAEPHAFMIYDSESRALATHVIRPLGRRPAPAPSAGTLCAYEIREAFAPLPSVAWTDERGNLVRLDAGDMMLTLASESEINTRYADKRDEAMKRAAALKPPAARP
jgi:hypothetical protein